MDVLHVLKKYHIPYETHGSGIRKGSVAIHCPFCGSSDRGHHMTIRLSDGLWGCWRNTAHSGYPIDELIKKLRPGAELPDITDNGVHGTSNATEFSLPAACLELGTDFSAEALPYWKYWRSRTLLDPANYDVRYCYAGTYRYRLVLPVARNGEIVAFTARSISGNPIRYMSSRVDTKGRTIKDFIYNYDNVVKNERAILYVCEGPFDAIKVDEVLGVGSACALFNCDMSYNQMKGLIELSKLKDKVTILMDKDAFTKGGVIYKKLVNTGMRGVGFKSLFTVKDPGELTVQVARLEGLI